LQPDKDIQKPTSPRTSQTERHVILDPPTLPSILDTNLDNTSLKNFLADMPDKYRDILSLYEKGSAAAGSPTAPGSCPFLAVQCCIRIAKLCAGLWRYGFNGICTGGAGISLYNTESKTSSGIADLMGAGNSNGGSGNDSSSSGNAERIVLNNGVGVSRLDVSSWVMKAKSVPGFEQMTLADQVWCTTNMAAVYSIIGFKRKHAFFLHETGLLVLSTLKPSQGSKLDTNLIDVRLPSSASIDMLSDPTAVTGEKLELVSEKDSVTGRANGLGKGTDQQTNGALECMKRVCEVLGVPLRRKYFRIVS
jgi:hypothetical protein